MDKLAVEQAFSLAAFSYDDAAHLQRRVADELLGRVSVLPLQNPEHIIDLGTGTGYCLPKLHQRFQPGTLSALDLSQSMLDIAQSRVPEISLIQADLESPPLAPSSIDLAVSSLAVQWLDTPEPFITRMSQALKPGGYLALSTLGPKTLCELRLAWSQVDNQTHVNNFHPAVDWIESVWQSDLSLELWREERIEIRYNSPLELLRELKTLGANHVDRETKPKGSHLRQMLNYYQGFLKNDGRYPATWDVYYLVARKPK